MTTIWPDPARPGVPPKPEIRSWHWLYLYNGIPIPAYWDGCWIINGNRIQVADLNPQIKYWGECLTPAEVDALKAEVPRLNTDGCARDQSTTQFWKTCQSPPKLITDNICLTPAEVASQANDALMEAARQSALAECIAACDAVIRLYRVELPEKYKFKPEGIPFEWEQTGEGWAEIAEDIAAAIRALSDTPCGMVLVPLEPTSAMIQACLQAALDFTAETKTTEVHPGQTYPSPSENARRCWRAMLKAAGKGEGDE
jgi:hypothetical protein